MIEIISPTGQGIRNDPAGSGSFGALRGNRLHRGTDFLCAPGSAIFSPIEGKIVRAAYPYADDLTWTGCLMKADQVIIRMFYMRLFYSIQEYIDKKGEYNTIQGQTIGITQDITKRYPDKGMKPHVHLELKIDGKLVDPMKYIKGD